MIADSARSHWAYRIIRSVFRTALIWANSTQKFNKWIILPFLYPLTELSDATASIKQYRFVSSPQWLPYAIYGAFCASSWVDSCHTGILYISTERLVAQVDPTWAERDDFSRESAQQSVRATYLLGSTFVWNTVLVVMSPFFFCRKTNSALKCAVRTNTDNISSIKHCEFSFRNAFLQ